MKLFAATLLATAAIAGAAAAQETKTYVALNLGANVGGQTDAHASLAGVGAGSGDIDHESGLFVSAAFGGESASRFAAEGELVYLKHDLEDVDADVELWAVMVNGRYTFMPDAAVSPYVGAGLGWGQATYSVTGGETDGNGLVWQLRAGAVVPVGDNLTFDVGYRYLEMPEAGASAGTATVTLESKEHIVTVGGRYSF